MSASYLRDQVINLSLNFIHYKDQWLNRFDALQEAHDLGYAEFRNHLSKIHRSIPQDVAEDIGEMGANMVVAGMALNGGPAAIAVPIVLGIKKLAGLLATAASSQPPDVSAVKTRLND